MEMHFTTKCRNSSAKWLSQCLSVQMTNAEGQWFKVTRAACISISTALDAQGMAVLPNSLLPPPVGRWTQQTGSWEEGWSASVDEG